ncbi:MAG: galactosyltransferase-related protein [Phycisphaerales bacterium]|nr:galactosyltransferase-related protein [Phycisphaerales bacterium]
MTARIHVILTTHTTRHLRRSLLGVATQRRMADEIVVTCDNDLADIAEVVSGLSRELDRRIVLVQRPNMGQCRVGQARNNGVRALVALGASAGDRVVYFDGDCCPAADVLGVHEQRGASADVLVGFRIDLTPEQTDVFDEASVLRGGPPVTPHAEQMWALARRDRRYKRQVVFRRVGLTKRHKPKILSAHFSVRMESVLKVNGFDEEFMGWGQEDDDLGRRLYDSGATPGVVVREAVVYHQWHPTRAPERWSSSAGVERFRSNLPWRCERGIENPLDQSAPVVRVFEKGDVAESLVLGSAVGSAVGAASQVRA